MKDKKAGKPEDELRFEVIRRQMNAQLDILGRISAINIEETSVRELLNQALAILTDQWYAENISVQIRYDDQEFATDGFSRTKWNVTSSAEAGGGNTLDITITWPDEDSYADIDFLPDEQQKFIDTVARELASGLQGIHRREKLAEKQKRVDNAYKLARIGTWEYDMINHELHWSSLTKEVHGFEDDHVPDVEHTVNLFKEGFDRETFAKAANDAIEHEIPFDIELKIISGKGDERWIRATAEPEYEDGKCIRFYGISQNVTSRKQAEENIQLSEQRFRALVQEGSDIIAILDEEAVYKYVSPTVKPVLGYSSEELVGKNAFDFIHKDDRDRLYEVLSSITSVTKRLEIEPYRFKNSNGEWRWFETTITDLRDDPAVGGLAANSRDITARKEQQQQLIESLAEKETLLAEIHHRVKNNLAIVVGLLQLQSSDNPGKEESDRLRDCVTRIQTMSQIHEQLYQSNNFSRLDFAENIQRLTDNILKTFKSDLDLSIDSDIEPVHLNITQAIPCSLIINEVLTNVLKHAFVGRDSGTILIRLAETDDNTVQLKIKDNGVGMPEDFDPATSGSLGMTLIGVISSQIKAEYEFKSAGNGTAFYLEFKKAEGNPEVIR